MPIEIKELHVKAVVVADQRPPVTRESVNVAKLKREIADDVFRKLLRRLGQKNER